MSIWAIADLHLGNAVNKPMDIFGDQWGNHQEKIKEGWQSVVGEGDLVIIPGDISWAMQLSEAVFDLEWIASLPGKKVMVRGNHDYWWSSLKKIQEILPESLSVIQNNHFPWGDIAVCGTRGWLSPEDQRSASEADEKIYRRELQRLELSLKSARESGFEKIIAALHFPPFAYGMKSSGFTQLISEYKVKYCIYGHLHAEAIKNAFVGESEGVEYVFASADFLNFTPTLVLG